MPDILRYLGIISLALFFINIIVLRSRVADLVDRSGGRQSFAKSVGGGLGLMIQTSHPECPKWVADEYAKYVWQAVLLSILCLSPLILMVQY